MPSSYDWGMKTLAAILLVALSTAAVNAASPPVRLPPPTVPEILAMLEAGIGQTVILRMISDRGVPAVVTVPDLLVLRSAGAADPLLEALAGGPAEAVSGVLVPSTTGGLRTWVEIADHGERVLHVTNLDPDGRRIGGEISSAERRHLASGTIPVERRDAEADREEISTAPVVVNVYTRPAPDDDRAAYPGWIGAFPPAGRYPGLLYPHHRGGSPRPAATREEFFGRPRIIDTTPYRAATAAQRNRARVARN